MILPAALPAFLLLIAQSRQATAIGLPNPFSDSHKIDNNRNTRYTAALTIAGQVINVTLDTGSTDLWLDPPVGLQEGFESTGINHQITYGDGSAYINGTIGLANITIAGYTIPRQAFINVTTNVGLSECGNGICGLVGLGFDNPDVGIEYALTEGGMDGPAIGKSVLSSIFDQTPGPADKNRFFAISLSRLDDEESSPHASLTVGDYDPDYTDVQFQPKQNVFPPGQPSWHVLTDGVISNGVKIYWPKNHSTTPPGFNRIGLDTGVPNILMRPEIRDSIYYQVPGAVLAKNTSIHNPYWSSDEDVWIVPCNTSIEFTTSFSGQLYPIHPLDMTAMYTQTGPDGVTYTVCAGSISNGGSITDSWIEAQYGDSFLRNVYTVFSFGDKLNETAPYVQFLSQTDPTEAKKDFYAVRERLLAKGPPELAPADLIRLFDGPPGAWKPSSTSVSTSAKVAAAIGDSTADSSTVSKWAPIVIGLLGANLALLIVLVALGVIGFIRNGRTTGATRSPSVRYVPARVKDDSFMRPSVDEDRPYSDRLP